MATTIDYPRIMNLFDRAENIFGPVSADIRKKLFRAIEIGDDPSWDDAKRCLIAPGTTLWQATVNTGVHPDAKPTPEQIIDAMDRAVRSS